MRPQSGKVRPLNSLALVQSNKQEKVIQNINVAGNVGPNTLEKLKVSLSSAGIKANITHNGQEYSVHESKQAATYQPSAQKDPKEL